MDYDFYDYYYDSDHYTIMIRAKKHRSVYSTRHWGSTVIPMARKNNPYKVEELQFQYFNFKNLAETLFNKLILSTNGNKVQWMMTLWHLQFRKNDKINAFLKNHFSKLLLKNLNADVVQNLLARVSQMYFEQIFI